MRSLSYRSCIVVLALSPVLAFVWYFFAIAQTTHQANEFQRVAFQGGGEVRLDRGPHTLWLEGPFVSVRRNSATEYRQILSPEVTQCDTESSVPVRRTQSQVFNIGGREGRSLWAFDVREAGAYCVNVNDRYDPDVEAMLPRAIAVGEGVGLRVPVRPWFMVILLAGVVLAVALGLRTHANRRRVVATGP